MVRPAESAWTTTTATSYGGKTLETHGEEYVEALRDWVINGEKSPFAMSDEEFRQRIRPRSEHEAEADASFKLAVWFHDSGNGELAAKYWMRAQQLNPDDWNYARQDWSFTPGASGRNWLEKFQKYDKEYYPLEMKPKR